MAVFSSSSSLAPGHLTLLAASLGFFLSHRIHSHIIRIFFSAGFLFFLTDLTHTDLNTAHTAFWNLRCIV